MFICLIIIKKVTLLHPPCDPAGSRSAASIQADVSSAGLQVTVSQTSSNWQTLQPALCWTSPDSCTSALSRTPSSLSLWLLILVLNPRCWHSGICSSVYLQAVAKPDTRVHVLDSVTTGCLASISLHQAGHHQALNIQQWRHLPARDRVTTYLLPKTQTPLLTSHATVLLFC